MKLRFKILLANIINSFQQDVAFFGANIFGILSVIFYALTLVVFIEVLFLNINTLAGYSKSEILFLFFISEINFFFCWSWTENNRAVLYKEIKNGALDFVLARPVPSLFYVTFRKISFVNFFRDNIPQLLIVSFLIKWGELNLSFVFVLYGILILILGQIAWNGFCYLICFPVFWLGEAEQVYKLHFSFDGLDNIPYEGLSGFFKKFFTVIVPCYLSSAVSVSVMLGKSDGLKMLLLALIVAIMFSTLKRFVWKLALKNYTSAA